MNDLYGAFASAALDNYVTKPTSKNNNDLESAST
jgi:hypothetical protein